MKKDEVEIMLTSSHGSITVKINPKKLEDPQFAAIFIQDLIRKVTTWRY